MGGFIRKIIRSFASKRSPVAVAQTVSAAQPVQAMGRRISKPYMDETIMTGAEGLEDEANITKAQLGGTILKKKKYKV